MLRGTPVRVTEDKRLKNRCFRLTDEENQNVMKIAKYLQDHSEDSAIKVSGSRALARLVAEKMKQIKQ